MAYARRSQPFLVPVFRRSDPSADGETVPDAGPGVTITGNEVTTFQASREPGQVDGVFRMLNARLPQAILVDLDDTILDDEGSIPECWRAVCIDAAQHRADLEPEQLNDEIKRVSDWFWSDPERQRSGRLDHSATIRTSIIHSALTSLGHCDPDLARAIAEAYRERRKVAIQPFPGAIEALAKLAARGIRLALITNGAGLTQRAKIERFDLTHYFDHILIEGEFGVGKPDERVYLKAMEVLDSRPSDTLMVGDNFEWEVVAPQKLGLRTVWIDRSGRGVAAESPVAPDHVITALRQLPGLLWPEK